MPWDGRGESAAQTAWRVRCVGKEGDGSGGSDAGDGQARDAVERGCSTKRSPAEVNGLVADLGISSLGREMEGTRHTGFWKNLPFALRGSREP